MLPEIKYRGGYRTKITGNLLSITLYNGSSSDKEAIINSGEDCIKNDDHYLRFIELLSKTNESSYSFAKGECKNPNEPTTGLWVDGLYFNLIGENQEGQINELITVERSLTSGNEESINKFKIHIDRFRYKQHIKGSPILAPQLKFGLDKFTSIKTTLRAKTGIIINFRVVLVEKGVKHTRKLKVVNSPVNKKPVKKKLGEKAIKTKIGKIKNKFV